MDRHKAIRKTRVLLVTNGGDRLSRLQSWLRRPECHVECAGSWSDIRSLLAESCNVADPVDIAVTAGGDAKERALSATAFAQHVKKISPETAVMVIVPYGDIARANKALQKGADAWAYESTSKDEIRQRIISCLAWRDISISHMLRGFLDNDIGMGVRIMDRSYRVRYENPWVTQRVGSESKSSDSVCWLQDELTRNLRDGCPWCAVRSTFEDGTVNVRTTILTRDHVAQFCEVTSVPVRDTRTGDVIAAVEFVRDITESMVRSCRGAFVEGEDVFLREMHTMLERMCDLGFERARLFMLSRDPEYLDLFATFGPHAKVAEGGRFRCEKSLSTQTTDKRTNPVHMDSSKRPELDLLELHPMAKEWLEVPLLAPGVDGGYTLIGKINLDNELTQKPLKESELFWGVLMSYGKLLAPIIADARDHWWRRERIRQAETLRILDTKLARASSVSEQMESILACAKELLSPDRCHIRVRDGGKLVLAAELGEPSRVRRAVDIRDSGEIGVSVELTRSHRPEEPRILGPKELGKLADSLEKRGLKDAAIHLRELGSCGGFALLGRSGIIGTLVLDAVSPNFFDRHRISLAQDLVRRAEVLVEKHLLSEAAQAREIQVSNLLDAVPAEIAVLDKSARVTMHNHSLLHRMKTLSNSYTGDYGAALGCVKADTTAFRDAVEYVFKSTDSTHLVARFAGSPEMKDRQMDVTVAPLDVLDGNVESVVVLLTDATGQAKVQLLSEGMNPKMGLVASLATPIGKLLNIFKADRASVTECFSFVGEDAAMRVWYGRGRQDSAHEPKVLPAMEGVGGVLEGLLDRQYLTIPDVSRSDVLPTNIRDYIIELDLRSVLAVPIRAEGEPWGVLAVAYERKRSFSAQDVSLLKEAATQIELLVLSCQQRVLREIDEELTAELTFRRINKEGGLLHRILERCTMLANCQGGHIRKINWSNDEAVIEVALPERDNPVRESVAFGDPVSGWVIKNRKGHICNDISDDRFARNVHSRVLQQRSDVAEYYALERSYACVPVIAGGEILGTLALSAQYRGHFSETRRQLLRDFASRIALAMRTARHQERMEGLLARLDVILKKQRVEEIWQVLPRIAVEVLQAEYAEVSSYDRTEEEICREQYFRIGEGQIERWDLDKKVTPSDEDGQGFVRWVAKTCKPIRLAGDEARTDRRRWSGGAKYYAGRAFHSIVAVPLITPGGRLAGVLKVENRRGREEDQGFTDFDMTMLDLLATKSAATIQRLRAIGERDFAAATRAHGMKGPLSSVRTFLDNLRKGRLDSLSEGTVDASNKVYENTRLLQSRIDSMVEVIKGELAADKIEPTVVCVGSFLRDVCDIFTYTLVDHEWHLSVNVSPKDLEAYFDANAMARVIVNLISNVLQHGYIDREDSPPPGFEKRIDVTVRSGGASGEVVLAVADRGPGIPEDRRIALLKPGPGGLNDEAEISPGIGFRDVLMVATAHCGSVNIAGREDGKSGAVVEVSWNQESLRREVTRSGDTETSHEKESLDQ